MITLTLKPWGAATLALAFVLPVGYFAWAGAAAAPTASVPASPCAAAPCGAGGQGGAATPMPAAAPAAGAARGGAAAGRLKAPTPYLWRQVSVGGGGTVTSFAAHPREPGLVYAGADVGGPMRRDPKTGRWTHLTDHLGPDNIALYHVECLALDPNDPDAVFYSAGKEWQSGKPSVLRSFDRGKTWAQAPLRNAQGKDVFVTNGRTGKRLAVDPHKGAILYYGSRRDGLLRSGDRGATWSQVADFPAPGTGPSDVAVRYVLFDPAGGKKGEPTPTIYAGVAPSTKDAAARVAEGVWRSRDAGRTWERLPDPPGAVAVAELDKSGALVGAGRGLFRFRDGAWQDITPDRKRGFFALAVSPNNPDWIVAAQDLCGWGNALFRTLDGGKTWARFCDDDFGRRGKGTVVQADWQPWEQGPSGEGAHIFACASSLTFDNADPEKLWLTHWPGIARCADVTAPERLAWSADAAGHEEVCLFDLVSPPAGPPLFSGLMDCGGFRHDTLTGMPAERSQFVGLRGQYNDRPEDVSDLDFCEARPSFLVAAGGWKHNNTGTAGFSADGGKTWQNFPAKPFPDAKNGRIAVSAANPDVIVWAPRDTQKGGTPVYATRDGGKTWALSQGAPLGMVYGEFVYTFYQPLESDRVKPDTFYLYDRRDGKFFRSVDGGATFRHTASLPGQTGIHYDQHTVRAAPGKGGEVWAALDDKGLFRSPDGGDTWAKLGGVERAWRFGWGAPMPGSGTPVAFVLGRVASDEELPAGGVALYRSVDLGATWTRLSDPKEQGWGQASVLNGDRRVPGRVYVGTNGRGIFYGEPAAKAPAPARTASRVRPAGAGR